MVSKGQSQAEICAAFLLIYMFLGSRVLYQVLIVTRMCMLVGQRV